jgi:glycosyltransferase involved in cell wall biosynthesis/ribosomal protein S18 acetylase RimI-like enzyme
MRQPGASRDTPRPVRLVHVTTTDMSLQLLLGPQLAAFRDAGYEVIGMSAPGPYVEGLVAAGIRHVPLEHATRAMAPGEDARALVELTRRFRELRPDIVHTHNPKPGVYGRIAARLAGVPAIVNTVHGLYAMPSDPLAKRAVVYGLERLAATCSGAELVQNPEDIPVLARLGISPDKLHLLGNGVDLSRFDPDRIDPARSAELRRAWGAGPDDVVVGLVGRLVVEKGYREVFAAAAQLRERCPRALFVVIGPDDPDKGDAITLEEREHAASEARIVFLGSRNDVDDCYSAMDCYLLASWREGFPRSAMEASAMGLPIIATDIRGCRQVVADGVTGWLVPPRSPDALAEAVERTVLDPMTRQTMGKAARGKALAEFDQRHQIELTLATYERLLARRDRRAPHRDGITVRPAGPADAAAVAALHADRIGEGFLASLGEPFLRRLYQRIARHPGSWVMVAELDGTVVGMASATLSTRRLYRSFVLRDGLVAGWAAAPRLLRGWRQVLETLRYPGGAGPADAVGGSAGAGSSDLASTGTVTFSPQASPTPRTELPHTGLPCGELPHAEILSVAVAESAGGRGVGTAVVTAALDEFQRRHVDAVRVVTVVGNDGAIRMYERCGFVKHSRTEVHAGIAQEVLVWRPTPTSGDGQHDPAGDVVARNAAHGGSH